MPCLVGRGPCQSPTALRTVSQPGSLHSSFVSSVHRRLALGNWNGAEAFANVKHILDNLEAQCIVKMIALQLQQQYQASKVSRENSLEKPEKERTSSQERRSSEDTMVDEEEQDKMGLRKRLKAAVKKATL